MVRVYDRHVRLSRVSTAMMMFDAGDEVMSKSGGLHVWDEIGERSASLEAPRRAAKCIVCNQHRIESTTTTTHTGYCLKKALEIMRL